LEARLRLPLTVLLVSLRVASPGKAVTFAAALAAVVSRWSKISLHTSIGAFCTVTLVAVNMWVAGAALLLATAVGWARVWLDRHTLWHVDGAIGRVDLQNPIRPVRLFMWPLLEALA
jgi:hypothetical protein